MVSRVKATLLGPTSIGHSSLPPCPSDKLTAGIRVSRLFDSHAYRSISATRCNDRREFSPRSRLQNNNAEPMKAKGKRKGKREQR
ncbi:hypothetical protein PILCRDRAFT_812248 [Piloderma croceum F 1598]|uniref:Uncharacterized protein n=1 Tax=Piloderma croceum (strain F 1598) TaxID=765440 RepID=A0A0C3CLG0_PILCF|nr:hypothetical protein PILCRDRAFT_812248 [Piloderma croceum F 1598]